MNMIALNNTTTTQPRLKRATVKGKASRTAKPETKGKPAELTLKQNEAVGRPNQANTSTTAKRLINTKSLSREEWLAVRKQGIGSSDSAAAVGLTSTNGSRAVARKTGRDSAIPKVTAP